MELLLNNILKLTEEEIDNSKIEFNMQAGSGGQPFLDRWLKHTDEEKGTGTCKDCSYWGWYVFFVKHFSLKKASKFPVFSEGFSLLQAGRFMHPDA